PFPGGTTMQKLQRHQGEEPVPVSQLNPTVPVAFHAVLQRMMAKRPERRLATAAAVRQELLAWTGNVPVSALDLKAEKEYEQTLAAMALARVSPEQFWQEAVGPAPGAGKVASAATGLPFWLDYLVPVGVGLTVLAVGWWAALKYLLLR